MAKTYAVVVGVVLLLVGILGFVTDQMFGLMFHPAHNVIHLLTGAIGLWAGFGKSANAPKLFAQVFGVVYTLVAIAGFAGMVNLGPIRLGLNTNYNVIHLVVGLWGLWAGFAKARAVTA